MNANIISLSPDNFHYQLLPSAFKIAECPTYLCWKSINFSEELWDREAVTDWERTKNRTIAILAGAGGYLGGVIALPMTLCSVPVTLLADVVIGATECIFCLYHGLKKEDLLIIAHRKFIVSPCQHLTFCLGAITGLGASWVLISTYTLNPWLGFKSSLIFWSLGYACGQIAVGILPKSLNHQSLNIFIGGGSGEGQDEQEKWFNAKIFNQTQSEPSFGAGAEIEWENFITTQTSLLGRIDDANLNIHYLNFKNRLLNKCEPIELLDLSTTYSLPDLENKYRQLALILHPDKNLPRQQEAHVLFTVLQQAYNILKNR